MSVLNITADVITVNIKDQVMRGLPIQYKKITIID